MTHRQQRVDGYLRSLSLDQTHEDVFGVGDLVVVELVVLRSSAVHPNRAVALDEHAATVVDVDLVVVGEVELVVRHPEPAVLNVGTGLLGDVQQHERTHALRVGGGLLVGDRKSVV